MSDPQNPQPPEEVDFTGGMADELPNFPTEENRPAFSNGNYLFILGKIYPVKDDSGFVIAVNNEIWAIKYEGDDSTKVSDVRISLKGGSVSMNGAKGVRLTERYPHPSVVPKMKWKSHAFFSRFGCISADADGRPEVVWAEVAKKYGTVFSAKLEKNSYISKKDQSRKSSMQFVYETIKIQNIVISTQDMHSIEAKFDELKFQEGGQTNYTKPPDTSVDDLPF